MNNFKAIIVGVIYFYLSMNLWRVYSRTFNPEPLVLYLYQINFAVLSLGSVVIICVMIICKKLDELTEVLSKKSHEELH